MSDTIDRASQLLAMTQRLVGLLEVEIEALKARRDLGAATDWDEKERLVHAWRIEVSKVKADPTLIGGIPETLKADLRTAAKQLEERLEMHAHALMASKTVTEGLVRSIANEIASTRSAPAAYGRSGAVNSGARREASGLTVNAKA
jgi:hypothetical protein